MCDETINFIADNNKKIEKLINILEESFERALAEEISKNIVKE